MKNRMKILLMLFVVSTGILTGCNNEKQKKTAMIGEEIQTSENLAEAVKTTESGEVEETLTDGKLTWEKRRGRQVNSDENFLYVCSFYRIYKVDKTSGETEVLWEQEGYREHASMFDYGNALLVEDKLYFVEEKTDSETGEVEVVLSVIHTDGSNYQTLVTDLSLTSATLFLQDDRMYITNYNGEFCYKILADGKLEKVEEGNYVTVPEGYQCESINAGAYYLSAAESLERYGYIIANDENHDLVKVEENGNVVKVEANWIESLNENWLLLRQRDDEKMLYRVCDAKTMESVYSVSFPEGKSVAIFGMDKEYIYYGYSDEIVDGIENFVVEKMAIRSGETEQLFCLEDNSSRLGKRYFGREDGLFEFSAEDGAFYYADEKDGKMYVVERSLTDIENEKVLTPVFYDSGISMVGTTEYYHERIFSDTKPDVELMEIQTERLVVDGIFPGAAKINKVLEEEEASEIAYGEEHASWLEEGLQGTEASTQDSDYTYVSCWTISGVSEVTYFDGNYFSFYQVAEEYWGGAHGMPYSYGYTFDLQTGGQLGLRDIVENDEEELAEIITRYATEYINKNPEEFWSDAVALIEADADYESAFYLSEEGIVFFYEPYFISSFAAGFQEITIPYEAFRLKLPLGEIKAE